MRLAGSVLALALVAPAPSLADSIFDYGQHLSDATVVLAGDTFRIYVHASRNTILIQPSMTEALMGGGHFPTPTWRLVAEKFVYPIGCGISDVVALTKMGASWEATYVCPVGVDLRALVKAQRDALKRGEPLHGGIPPPAESQAVAEPDASAPAEQSDAGVPPEQPPAAQPRQPPPPARTHRQGCIKVPTDPRQDQC